MIVACGNDEGIGTEHVLAAAHQWDVFARALVVLGNQPKQQRSKKKESSF